MLRSTLHFTAVFVAIVYAWMLLAGTNPANIKAHFFESYAARGNSGSAGRSDWGAGVLPTVIASKSAL